MERPVARKITVVQMSKPSRFVVADPDGSIQSHLAQLLRRFEPVGLLDIREAALQDRVDIKYVLTFAQLLEVLPALSKDYKILEVSGNRLNHYRTLYFDTPAFDLYNMHVNGRADRYKVRSREYADTSFSVFEVKHKTRKDRTIKERMVTEKPLVNISGTDKEWLGAVMPASSMKLEPKIWNSFSRITLVNCNSCERVTIDLNIAFSSEQKAINLDHLVVIEAKLESAGCRSPFVEMMRSKHIHEQSFSKYCIGISMLYEQVKKNSLKPQLLQINKIIAGAQHE